MTFRSPTPRGFRAEHHETNEQVRDIVESRSSQSGSGVVVYSIGKLSNYSSLIVNSAVYDSCAVQTLGFSSNTKTSMVALLGALPLEDMLQRMGMGLSPFLLDIPLCPNESSLLARHGTHTAAIAVGTKYGIARNAQVVAVKVLSDDGWGWTSDIISGVIFAHQRWGATGKPSIANLSFGGTVSPALDSVITGVSHAPFQSPLYSRRSQQES